MWTVYREKVVEEFIRDYPKEFLGEELLPHAQQPFIRGFRPDLIFKDRKNRLVIVEVQLQALDRDHLYRALEYRDLVAHEESCPPPRVILFCNALPQRFEQPLRTHRIRCITLSKQAFLERAHALRPDIRITDAVPVEDDPFPTGQRILQALQGAYLHAGAGIPDALVFWFSGDFPYGVGCDYLQKFGSLPLSTPDESVPRFFDDWQSQGDSALLERVPRELIVGREALEALSLDQIEAMEAWLDLLAADPGETQEIVLGHRRREEFYQYGNHIYNRIRTFRPLWHRYGRAKGYDTHLLNKDMRALERISLFAGKVPVLRPVRLCQAIEIAAGPGPLQKDVELRMAMERDWAKEERPGYSAKRLADLERFLEQDRTEWVTVTFRGVSRGLVSALRQTFRMVTSAHRSYESRDVKLLLRKIGLQPARPLCTISPRALALSAKYFAHFGGPYVSSRSGEAYPPALLKSRRVQF